MGFPPSNTTYSLLRLGLTCCKSLNDPVSCPGVAQQNEQRNNRQGNEPSSRCEGYTAMA